MTNVSFEPFSREPEYVEVNRLFIQSLGLPLDARVLDVACGTGTLTGIIRSELDARSTTRNGRNYLAERRFSIIGLDICRECLMLAERYLANTRVPGQRAVYWLQASATALPLKADCMEAVIIGNAIQLFDTKREIVSEAGRVLVRGGILAFNTSFYAGTFLPGTERFYLLWVQEALRYIHEKDSAGRIQGQARIPRKKGYAKPAFSNRWLGRREYECLLAENSFEVQSVVERTVTLTQHSLEVIGSYAGLASVLLSGYPVELACEALERSVGTTMSALGVDTVPRYWIEFVARKR
jgi:ubiquinone/menaquinone biosynthesis C-methylase UbiE